VIGHDRRRVFHHDVTNNPNALWIELQRFLIFDRDAKFSADVVSTVKAMAVEQPKFGIAPYLHYNSSRRFLQQLTESRGTCE
jgi:hypothetical protein